MAAEDSTKAAFPRGQSPYIGGEHGMRSLALSRLAAGLAHDVKNPLNAMALQIAILADKLSAVGPELSEAVTSHLGSLKEQIGRVNEAVRRFADVAEPGGPVDFTDVGLFVADLARLFSHEARRRRVEITCETGRGHVCSPCDSARLGRLIMGLFWRVLAETPPGTRLSVYAGVEGDQVVVRFERPSGPEVPELAFVTDVVASSVADLGGRLMGSSGETGVRFLLYLPWDAEP